MRVITLHSTHERCGIHQYGEQLDRSLARLLEVAAYNYFPEDLKRISETSKNDDVLLAHYEPVLVGDDGLFRQALDKIKANGSKVVFCCHWFQPGLPAKYPQVDRFIVHRDYGGLDERVTHISLGCPVYTPYLDKSSIREKFKLPQNKLIVITAGFLAAWKKIPDIAELVAQRLPANVVLRVQAAHPFGKGSPEEEAKLVRAAGRSSGKLTFSTQFIPEDDLLDLVYASDLGFVYHGVDTQSCSAAVKQYVSTRCPVVVTKSSHASDVIKGVARVPSLDMPGFVNEVISLVSDARRLELLHNEMEDEYQRLNMHAVARTYLKEFKTLLGAS